MSYLSFWNLNRLVNERGWTWLIHPGRPHARYLRNTHGQVFAVHTAARPAPASLVIEPVNFRRYEL